MTRNRSSKSRSGSSDAPQASAGADVGPNFAQVPAAAPGIPEAHGGTVLMGRAENPGSVREHSFGLQVFAPASLIWIRRSPMRSNLAISALVVASLFGATAIASLTHCGSAGHRKNG
jgi:hypothetical protein